MLADMYCQRYKSIHNHLLVLAAFILLITAKTINTIKAIAINTAPNRKIARIVNNWL